MKKLLLSISIAANVTFMLIACSKDNLVELKDDPLANAASTRSRLLNQSATACAGPYEGMPYALVQQMINNYRTNQQEAIQNGLGISDANMCWFELERLKNFICHLETRVAETNCANVSGLGLRFYYGAHGNNPAAYGLPDNYAYLHNLVVVPTYRNADGVNVDFDPSRIDQANCTPVPLKKLEGREKMNNLLTGTADSSKIFAMDHGQLGPPDNAGSGF